MRRGRLLLWSLFAALALVLAAAFLALAYLAGDPSRHLVLTALAGAFLAPVGLAFVFLLLDRVLLAAPLALAREIELVLARPDARFTPPEGPHLMAPLVGAVERLVEALAEAQRRVTAERAAAAAESERLRRRLEAILRDLNDGLVCCSHDGRILLYNDAARRILGAPPALGLGRALDDLLDGDILAHHLRSLRRAAAVTGETGPPVGEPFLCPSADRQHLLRCRLSLIGGEADTGEGFVIVFAEAGHASGRDDADRFIDDLAKIGSDSLGALRAAAGTLASDGGHDAEERRRCARIVLDETKRLEAELAQIAETGRDIVLAGWPLHDLRSSDLVEILEARLSDRALPVRLGSAGEPAWFRGDSYALARALESFIADLACPRGIRVLALEARPRAGEVALDLVWEGDPIPGDVLEAWLVAAMDGEGTTPRQLFARHRTEPRSADHDGAGRAHLRLSLAPAHARHAGRPLPALPPRPEFYDFDLALTTTAPLAERPLLSLTFVVFDAETTGLDPRGGDEMVQLAGVRVVNGRVLRGETFDSLIDPGRPVPPASTRFHGITGAMLEGQPPVEAVLARFKSFVGDAVLVAHNAAFDLAFLRKHEAGAGVVFDNPVLDTLLLSVVIHDHTAEHSLEAAAARFGIAVRDRHSALGDSLATAELLVRLIRQLELRGITTFGETLAVSRKAAATRRRQAEQFGVRHDQA